MPSTNFGKPRLEAWKPKLWVTDCSTWRSHEVTFMSSVGLNTCVRGVQAVAVVRRDYARAAIVAGAIEGRRVYFGLILLRPARVDAIVLREVVVDADGILVRTAAAEPADVKLLITPVPVGSGQKPPLATAFEMVS